MTKTRACPEWKNFAASTLAPSMEPAAANKPTAILRRSMLRHSCQHSGQMVQTSLGLLGRPAFHRQDALEIRLPQDAGHLRPIDDTIAARAPHGSARHFP